MPNADRIEPMHLTYGACLGISLQQPDSAPSNSGHLEFTKRPRLVRDLLEPPQ
jgi:hypothetical protein